MIYRGDAGGEEEGGDMNFFVEYKPGSSKGNADDVFLSNCCSEDCRNFLPDFTIRMAEKSDEEQLAHITFSRSGGSLEEHQRKFREELSKIDDHEKRLLLVAETGGKVVGFGRVKYFTPPEDSPINTAPEGWYLMGVIVDPGYQRRGLASMLTEKRLEWLREGASEVFYFANARNLASMDLHEKFGFKEVTRDFVFPGVSFIGGEGVLFRGVLGRERNGKINHRGTEGTEGII